MAGNVSKSVMYLSVGDLADAFPLLYVAGITPNVVGGPGSGKTTAIKSFADIQRARFSAKGVEYKYWLYLLSHKLVEDISGLPKEIGGHVSYLMLPGMPFDNEDFGLIHADEVDRAPSEVQTAFTPLLLERCVHGHTVSKNAWIVLSCNGTSDVFTTELSEALRTRVCTLYVSTHADGADASYDAWAAKNNISPLMRSFARHRGDLIAQREDFEELSVCNSRTRDMADSVVRAADTLADAGRRVPERIVQACVAGLIGREAAIAFMDYRKLYKAEMAQPEQILKEPKTARLPASAGLCYAAMCTAVGMVKAVEDCEIADKVAIYIMRMPDEVAELGLRRIADVCGQVNTNPDVIKWRDAHVQVSEA